MTLRSLPFPARLLRVLPLLVAAGMAAPAAAHSELRGSDPASGAQLGCAPDRIELHFNEGVQLTALRLHRADGAEIALAPRAIREATTEIIALPALEPGEFRAEWRVISADGHVVGGTIPFRIIGANCQ